jgi:GT2 family glycosyltransferase
MPTPVRSFIMPILDSSPHSHFNIMSLLRDLNGVPGEVICVFNSREAYEQTRNNARIDKFCFNSQNAGISRAWNIGLQLAESDVAFIFNADLHILPAAIERMHSDLFTLDRAVIVGPQGSHLDYRKLTPKKYFSKGTFDQPVATDDVSGFCFAIHLQRFLEHKLLFDVRFSPCFYEEWDMGLQIRHAGMACYAVPVTEFEHSHGLSQAGPNSKLNYFGKPISLDEIRRSNAAKFIDKWRPIYPDIGTDRATSSAPQGSGH